MSNLPKDQARLHRQAQELVDLDRPLTWQEREFVMTHWQESSSVAHGLDGAFFTPLGLAVDMSVEASGPEVQRVLDLCAGIGRLAWTCLNDMGAPDREVVCVERNPEYVRVGRKVLPEATWVCADIFDLPEDLGRFDMVVSNPPYGHTERSGDGPGVTGRRFEYHAVAVAAEVAKWGVFLIPQQSAPFRHSGERGYREERSADYLQFERDTGLRLEMGCSIDTSGYRHQWRGVAPTTEIVLCDFTKRTARSAATPSPAGPDRRTPVAVEVAATLF
ncbi:methyltransferase domain-containing protein [Kitasatospora sp. RB6PN24]|uniref:methyltransferase domain-containing protein n=1 Tax=Kitasatospora humi TaxID=2893891 RepID=UPI001E35D125|nr:methyltransferase domain-containing protein [Kitasatospora humi]MCC9309905.1 methyltransferase domain-containing protein [Kitasatospora humi]